MTEPHVEIELLKLRMERDVERLLTYAEKIAADKKAIEEWKKEHEGEEL